MRAENVALFIMLLILSACASKEPEKKPVTYPPESPEVTTTKPKGTSVTAKQVATEQGSDLVAELNFKKGESVVSKNDRSKINSTYQRAHKKGEIEEVQLITWADKEYPTEDKGELATKQKNLVEKRNKALEEQIKKLNADLEVNKISMAERASALEKFTASEEAKVKESLETKDAPDRAGQAMVIFILKEKS